MRAPCDPLAEYRRDAVPTFRRRIDVVVIFFEILLVLATLAIVWFGLYTLYRLINDES